MAFSDAKPRTVYQATVPMAVTLGGTVVAGDLLGYSSGWVRADADAGIPAKLLALEGGVSGDVIQAALAGLITSFTGGTAGGDIYLSDTAGGYSDSASSTSEQRVGQFLSTTEGYIDLHRFQEKLVVDHNFAAADVANIFFIAPFRCRVTKISEVHATVAGQTGTLTVERLQSTEAPGNGDDLLGDTKIDEEGTINTVQSPALTDTAANLVLEAGDRLALKQASGSATSLANACVTVELERA